MRTEVAMICVTALAIATLKYASPLVQRYLDMRAIEDLVELKAQIQRPHIDKL